MTIFEKVFTESKLNKKIIGIRMYGDDTKFWCGYIVDFNNDFIIIQHFSKHGLADGFILEKTENIESLDIDNNYSKSFQKLASKIENNYNDISILEIPTTENWQYELLSKQELKKKAVDISFTEDFTICGKIMEIDSDFVKIEPIEDLGELDGYSIYRLEDIDSIRLDSLELIKRSKNFSN